MEPQTTNPVQVDIPEMHTLDPGEAYVMGAGTRVDLLIRAGASGTYLLQALDPSTPRSLSAEHIIEETSQAQ